MRTHRGLCLVLSLAFGVGLLLLLAGGGCGPALTPGPGGDAGGNESGGKTEGIAGEQGSEKSPTDTPGADVTFPQDRSNPPDAPPGDQTSQPDAPSPDTPLADTPSPDRTPPGDQSPPADRSTTPDQGAADLPPIPPNTCFGVLACGERSCSWPRPIPCLDNCAKTQQLKGAAAKRWNLLRNCVIKECSNVCDPKDTKCQNSCVAAYCAKEWVSCATDLQSGTKTCKETVACAEKCNPRASSCQANCVSPANKDAQKLYTTALECAGLKDLKKRSPKQIEACNLNTLQCLCPQYIQGGKGTTTCEGYFKCIGACKSDDVCCYGKCRYDAGKDELKAADEFSTCMTKNCSACQNKQPCTNQCAIQHCLDPYRVCLCPRVGKPGSGAGKCSSALQCKCSAGDTCCQYRCLEKLGKKGLKLYLDVVTCGAQCNCASGDKTCNDKCYGAGGPCNKEASACVADR